MRASGRSLGRWLLGPDVFVGFLAFSLPVTVGAVETTLMTPLALPGYLLLTLVSAFGSHLFPTYSLWVFWVPFLGTCYGLGVAVAGVYRFGSRRRRSRG